MFKVKTLNNIAKVGLERFDSKHYKVSDDTNDPDAILVRSFKMHDMDIPEHVKVVGRAGAGVNNIPLDKMTSLGIPVLNTPGANANAVKELVLTGMLLASRNICRAWHYVQNIEGDDASLHKQVESQKKEFVGRELPGKMLGIIGLGNIGAKVANSALHLGMDVIGFDPSITVKHAWQLSSSVIQAEDIDSVLKRSDFISVHVPLNDHTRNLIDEKKIKKMKDGVVLLNFARDGIIDNAALCKALDSGKVNYYVCDFPNQMLQRHPRVICLPHLGASTKEAEENCAVMVANQIKDFLENGHIHNSVNFPNVKMPRSEGYRIAIANANVPNMVAQISTVLSNASVNIIDMINKSRESIAYTLIDTDKEISDELLVKIKAIDGVVRARRL